MGQTLAPCLRSSKYLSKVFVEDEVKSTTPHTSKPLGKVTPRFQQSNIKDIYIQEAQVDHPYNQPLKIFCRSSEGVSLLHHLQEMEVVVREKAERPQDRLAKGPSLAKLSTRNGGNDRMNCGWRAQAVSSRTGYMHRGVGGFSRQGSRSARGFRPEMAAPSDKFRRREAKKEILRRALTPPAKRPTLRWLDFRPSPSRLCNMSMA